MLIVVPLSWWLFQMIEQFLALIVRKFRRPSRSRLVVGSLLDRFLVEPIEPIADRFLDNPVAFSKSVDLIALLSSDRRENAFSRDLSLRLLT